MSELILNRIDITTEEIDSKFIYADIVDRGYKEPYLVNSLTKLNLYFRFDKNYKRYKRLIESGINLLLTGSNVDEYYTTTHLVLFKDNIYNIDKCIIDPNFELDESEDLNSYIGYNPNVNWTYSYNIKLNSIKEGDLLILPCNVDSSIYDISYYNIGFYFSKDPNSIPSFNKKYIKSTLINIDPELSKEEILNIIKENLSKLIRGKIIINGDSMDIISHTLINYFEFEGLHNDIKLTNNIRFTQAIYYNKALEHKIFECRSRLFGIDNKYLYVGKFNNKIKIKYFDYEVYYEDTNELVEVLYDKTTKFNYTNFDDIINVNETSPDTYIGALNQLYEYDEVFTVLHINPQTRDIINKGLSLCTNFGLLLINYNPNQEYLYDYIDPEKSIIFDKSSDEYLIDWIKYKYFKTDNFIKSTKYNHITQLKYSTRYEYEEGLLIKLLISTINTRIYLLITPGMDREDLEEYLSSEFYEIKSEFKLIEDINIENIEYEGNEVHLVITTTYKGIKKIIPINIKIK